MNERTIGADERLLHLSSTASSSTKANNTSRNRVMDGIMPGD